MLVITRKIDEAIELDGPGVVRILKILGGGRVRLGIEAPRTTNVKRCELPPSDGVAVTVQPTTPPVPADTAAGSLNLPTIDRKQPR